MLNGANIYSEVQVREAFGITAGGWAKWKRKHGMVRPKIGRTSWYTGEELHGFISSLNLPAEDNEVTDSRGGC